MPKLEQQEHLYITRYWNDYSKLIPKNAPKLQFIESKRAFFAGAQACLASICGFS